MRRINHAVILIGNALLLGVGLASADQPAPVEEPSVSEPRDKLESSPSKENALEPEVQKEPPAEDIQERGVPPKFPKSLTAPPPPSGMAPSHLGFVDLFPFLFKNNCSVMKYVAVPVQLLVGIGNAGTAVSPPTQVRVQVSQVGTTLQPATIDTPVPAVNPSTFVTVVVTLPDRFNCDGGACQFVITVDPGGVVQEQGKYYGFGESNNTTAGRCYFGA